MKNFDFNKFFASILIGLLAMQVFDLCSKLIVKPDYLEKNILGIDGGALIVTATADNNKLNPITPLLTTADAVNGEKIAKKCLQCHDFAKGGPNKTGPNLWGIVMSIIGNAPDFAYSKALKEHGGKWDFELLNKFLHKPRDVIKGTKMSFVGLANEKERADLIAYLRLQADNPVPFS